MIACPACSRTWPDELARYWEPGPPCPACPAWRSDWAPDHVEEIEESLTWFEVGEDGSVF